MEEIHNKIKTKLEDNICILLNKPNMSLEDLKFLGESVDILKDISIIEGMDDYSEEMEKGYSETSRDARRMTSRNRSMTAAYEHGYIDGVSNERGRSPHTGKFISRDEWRMDERHSGHSIDDRMVAAMEQMYDNASSEHERMRIDDVIKHIHKTGV